MAYPYLTSLFMNQESGSIRQTSILYTLHVYIDTYTSSFINNNEYIMTNYNHG